MFTISFPFLPYLDSESHTSTSLGNDHGFINKEYSIHWYEAFWGSPK